MKLTKRLKNKIKSALKSVALIQLWAMIITLVYFSMLYGIAVKSTTKK